MKRPLQERLAELHDDELSPRQARKLEEELARNPQNREEIRRFERMGDLLRLMSEEKCSEVSFENFAQKVAEGVRAQSRPSIGERFRVWVLEFFEHRKSIWVPGAALAAASLAVVLALPLMTGATSKDMTSTNGGPQIWTASAETFGYSEVDAVSFGDTTGQVYQLSDGQGGSAAVVWIVDEAD